MLGRDCAEVCTDFIQNNLGTQKSLGLRAGTCAICGDGLKEAVIVADRTTEETVRLPGCGHQFHDLCIRGWTIVGKKDTCPFCKEKVSLKQLHKQRPWESSNVRWNGTQRKKQNDDERQSEAVELLEREVWAPQDAILPRIRRRM